MIEIVKNQSNQIDFKVIADESIGAMTATLKIGNVTKSISNLVTGASVVFTAVESNTFELGLQYGILSIQNSDNTFSQRILAPTTVLATAAEKKEEHTIYSVLCNMVNDGVKHDGYTLPVRVVAGGKLYDINIADDTEGIDWIITRVNQ